ncbi:MAG: hypothetical protein M3Y08_18660 [Fibrobacterota bacterium]|nr:hypothetical protein [Fibrobacterota bacterium]
MCARQYLQGLMQSSDRKNMECMVEVVPDADYQALQQFHLGCNGRDGWGSA